MVKTSSMRYDLFSLPPIPSRTSMCDAVTRSSSAFVQKSPCSCVNSKGSSVLCVSVCLCVCVSVCLSVYVCLCLFACLRLCRLALMKLEP